MVTAEVWATPAGGATVTPTALEVNSISYAGGYWWSLTRGTASSDEVKIRYATDPTGTWSTATLPAAPVGYTTSYGPPFNAAVVSDGTTYATVIRYTNAGSLNKRRIVYCTDPGGTWSSYEFDTTDTYRALSIAYGNGNWVLVGDKTGTTPNPGFIAYSSTVNGTYTFNTSAASTGYDSTTDRWDIYAIHWDGTHWVSGAINQDTVTGALRVSTSLTSGWAAPSSATMTGTPFWLRKFGSYWVAVDTASTGSVLYATDPTGTWTEIPNATLGTFSVIYANAYLRGNWVTVGYQTSGGFNNPKATTLAGASPDGSYSTITSTTLTDPASANAAVTGVDAYGDYIVIGSTYDGELRYCYLPARQSTLRQRQSPRRSPSRVGYPALRQRQSPFIR